MNWLTAALAAAAVLVCFALGGCAAARAVSSDLTEADEATADPQSRPSDAVLEDAVACSTSIVETVTEILASADDVQEDPGLCIESSYMTLAPGEQGVLSCNVSGHPEKLLSWNTSDSSVVNVDDSGTVTAVGTGTAWVTAAADGQEDTVLVWVTDKVPYDPLTEIAAPRFTEENGILTNSSVGDVGHARIMLTGDLMALSAQQNAARAGSTYNYNSSFSMVKPIFETADFAVGNLETCLSYSSPYTAQEKTVQGNPNCNAQATYLDAVREAGYDAVVTANNHSGDTGIMGLGETIRMLDLYHMGHTGTFTSKSEPHFLLADVNGIRVAVLSYTEILNTKSGKLAITDEELPIVLNKYSAEQLQLDVAAARDAGAEYIIAYNHWGTENTHNLTDQQLEHAQQMADAGVDFIAGSHSHCLQPPAIITAADGRQVPCIFSMSNFVSSMAKDINNDTVILVLELDRRDETVALQDVGYISCRVFPEYEGGHHVIVPSSTSLNGGRETSSLASAQRRITDVLGTLVFREILALDAKNDAGAAE